MQIIIFAVKFGYDFDIYDDLKKTYNNAIAFLKENDIPTPTGETPEL